LGGRWNNGDRVGAVDLIFFGKVYNNCQGLVLIIVNKRILAAVRFFNRMSHNAGRSLV